MTQLLRKKKKERKKFYNFGLGKDFLDMTPDKLPST